MHLIFHVLHVFFVILFTYNRSLLTQNFSGWLDSRVEHQRMGHLHWGQQWHMAIDLSLCCRFPESFLSRWICWERVEVKLNCFIFGSFLIFRTFFLFWLGSTWVHVIPCDFHILYKSVLPPRKWIILFPSFIFLSSKNSKFLKYFYARHWSPSHSKQLQWSPRLSRRILMHSRRQHNAYIQLITHSHSCCKFTDMVCIYQIPQLSHIL